MSTPSPLLILINFLVCFLIHYATGKFRHLTAAENHRHADLQLSQRRLSFAKIRCLCQFWSYKMLVNKNGITFDTPQQQQQQQQQKHAYIFRLLNNIFVLCKRVRNCT